MLLALLLHDRAACPEPWLRCFACGRCRTLNEVLRQESKYLITYFDFLRLSGKLDQVMLQDPHNGSLGYLIRSLYFDTPYDEDYQDKQDGLELRRKVRLRIYDPKADFAMLELKQKQGSLQKKRSLRMSREDALRLIAGDTSVLLSYPEPFAAEMFGLMHRKAYRPKTIVEYKRKAFITKENKIRITFDHTLRASETCHELFSENPPLSPVLDGFNMVLEVKFNGFMLSYIKNMLGLSDRSAISISKYCMARADTLGLFC